MGVLVQKIQQKYVDISYKISAERPCGVNNPIKINKDIMKIVTERPCGAKNAINIYQIVVRIPD